MYGNDDDAIFEQSNNEVTFESNSKNSYSEIFVDADREMAKRKEMNLK